MKKLSLKQLKLLSATLWTLFIIQTGLMYYVNHYLPHGPLYFTGEYNCINDGRGPCGPDYKEDMRDLNVPSWVKFMRDSSGELLWMGLLFAAIVVYGLKEVDQNKKV